MWDTHDSKSVPVFRRVLGPHMVVDIERLQGINQIRLDQRSRIRRIRMIQLFGHQSQFVHLSRENIKLAFVRPEHLEHVDVAS